MMIARRVVEVLWALCSLFMIFKGILIFIFTYGYVQSSEFSMLITLNSQLSLLLIWLALFAAWSIVKNMLPK